VYGKEDAIKMVASWSVASCNSIAHDENPNIWRAILDMGYTANYVMLAIFFLLGLALPLAAFTAGRLLRPHKPTPAKRISYESGADPVGDSWIQFNVRYYLFALLFVIFDVETVFLYPWATVYHELRSGVGLFTLVEMLVFVLLLLVGLFYAWKKRVLEWK
jgi:NADH-quinone oxidoreductase subunit A